MKIFKMLYFWILLAFVLGIILGITSPHSAMLFKPLGTEFISLLKVFIGPIVFFTVVTGIAQVGSLKTLGKIGLKALIYFEIVSTVALLIGWGTALLLAPGSGLHIDSSKLDISLISTYQQASQHLSIINFIQDIIPDNLFSPFMNGNMLQILVLAFLFGTALLVIPNSAQKNNFLENLEYGMQLLFKAFGLIMYLAPLAVFGAMAFTIGKFGIATLLPLLKLISVFYLAGIIFIFIILGIISRCAGFSVWHFLRFIKTELVLVLGTSSSEAALPSLLRKLQVLGCSRKTVSIVVPMGYSFNLDGTNIYITLAALFIAQAFGIHLSIEQQLTIFLTAMLTSKGAAGVTGAGFITLAATLAVVPTIPMIGLVLILGIDRFMSEGRSLINFIGNGVAALVISRLEGELSSAELTKQLKVKITD